MCGAACVDPQSNNQHCGACGNTCSSGTVCTKGTCQPLCANGSLCAGACVDTRSDSKHCGQCGVSCQVGEVCNDGSCDLQCKAGLTACQGACVDLANDDQHCGACGNACDKAEVCTAGSCQLSCVGGTKACAGSCINTQNDRYNCGECGNKCKAGAVCSRGQCEVSCQEGLTPCDGSCVSLQESRRHCGACGQACQPGEVCSEGTCQVSCPSGQEVCAGGCVELKSNREHCGTCGKACGSGMICTNGKCILSCSTGTTACGGICADTQIDVRHCGACGKACGQDQRCIKGTCEQVCPNQLTKCGGVCRDLMADNNNCGACGNLCQAGEVCSKGKCQTSCQAGLSTCDGVCTDTNNHPAHCGTCGVACKSGEICTRGACQFKCSIGQIRCGDRCINNQSDRLNCGACGNLCPTGKVCVSGACQVQCLGHETLCGNRCVDVLTDRFNCGGCGKRACRAGEVCSQGKCQVSCQIGLIKCNEQCVSFLSDNNNCGACGNKCKAGESCSRGQCQLRCQSGLLICNGMCTQIAMNNKHCGKCNNPCGPGSVCSKGLCRASCGARQTLCAGTCADTQNDRFNCGKCGNTCSPGQVCNKGTCQVTCASQLSKCGSLCVDTNADRANCGACGKACGAGEVCVKGACELTCPSTQTACIGTCVNIKQDNANCGACGKACQNGTSCQKGRCVCPQGLVFCGNKCVDLYNDPQHCGRCGNNCGASGFCAKGQCVLACRAGETNCSGSCADLATNPRHCGACGLSCAQGAICTKGKCACPQGTTVCGGVCVDLMKDKTNCGTCGNICGSKGVCVSGFCQEPVQLSSYASTTDTENGRVLKSLYDAAGAHVSFLQFDGEASFATKRHSGGSRGYAIAKYDTKNKLLWSRVIATYTYGDADMAIGDQGAVYVVINFNGSAFVDGVEYKAPFSRHILLIKYDTKGKLLWTREIKGENIESGTKLIWAQTHLYVYGRFYQTLTLNQATIHQPTNNMFIARIDTQGATSWLKAFGEISAEHINAIGADIGLSGNTPSSNALLSAIKVDLNKGRRYAARINSQGQVLWAMEFTGAGDYYPRHVQVNADDSLTMIAYYHRDFTLGTYTFRTSYRYTSCMLMLKLNNKGGVIWALSSSVSGNGNYVSTSFDKMAMDSQGNAYASGSASFAFRFGNNTYHVATSYQHERFLLKVNNQGKVSWIRRFANKTNDSINQLTVSADDKRVLLSGDVYQSLTHGTTTLTTNSRKGLVLEFDSAGLPTQAHTLDAYSQSYMQIHNITSDQRGQLYMFGRYNLSATFGTTKLTAASGDGSFLVAMDQQHKPKWVLNVAARQGSRVEVRDVSAQGGVIAVVGVFRGTVDFGQQVLQSASSSYYSGFLGLLDANGQWLWARALESTRSTEPHQVLLAPGLIYVTGSTEDGLSLDGLQGSVTNSRDVFLAQFDRTGKAKWLTLPQVTGYAQQAHITLDSTGQVYLASAFSKAAIFGASTFFSKGSYDIFVAKYTSQGAWGWTKTFGDKESEDLYSLRISDKDGLYIFGRFYRSTTMGQHNLTVSGSSNQAVFLTRLTTKGDVTWAKPFVYSSYINRHRLAIDKKENAYFLMPFEENFQLQHMSLTTPYSKFLNKRHAAMIKVDRLGQLMGAYPVYSKGSINPVSITIDAADNPSIAGVFAFYGEFGGKSIFSEMREALFMYTIQINEPTKQTP